MATDPSLHDPIRIKLKGNTEMTEFKEGDLVTIKDPSGSKWDGLRAVIVDPRNGSGYSPLIRMDAGDKRPDGYDTEPFVWHSLELRSSDNGVTLTEVTDPNERISVLETMVATLETQSATLREQRNVTIGERNAAREELETFKERVVEVAGRYAIENDWCGEVVKALEEMGLEGTRERSVRINGSVTLSIPLCVSADDLEMELTINGESVDTLYNLEVSFDD